MSSLTRVAANNLLLVLLSVPVLPTRVRNGLAHRLGVPPLTGSDVR